MRLSEENTLKFAKLYRDHECLWNMKCPSYKDKHTRKAAIDFIVIKMGLPGFDSNEARSKIKNLRSTYYQEVAKIKKSCESSNGRGSLYKPQMKWFEVLDPVMKTLTNGTIEVQSMEIKEDSSDVDGEISENILEPFVSVELKMPSSPTIQKQPTTSIEPVAENPNPRNVKRKLHELSSAIKDLRNSNEYSAHRNADIYENEAFGKYVSKALDKLPAIGAIHAQHEIQSILTKYKLQAVQELKSSSSFESAKTYPANELSNVNPDDGSGSNSYDYNI